MVEARAAFGFRQRDAGETQLSGFAERIAGEMTSLVDLSCLRLHFDFGKFPHRALQQLLFFIQLEVQRVAPRNDGSAGITSPARGEASHTSSRDLPAPSVFRRSKS